MKRILLAAATILALITGAVAQSQPPIWTAQIWLPQSRLATPISAGASSVTTPLPTPGLVVLVCNTGAQDAYLAFGTSGSVTASTAAGTWLKAGAAAAYSLVPNPGSISPVYAYIAAITGSGSTTLYVETGMGTPSTSACGGNSTVTVTQGTTPWIVTTAIYSYTPLTPMQAGLTVAASTGLTPPATSTYAVVCVAGAAINYTTDGTTTPTTLVGMPLAAGQCIPLQGPLVLAAFKAIQVAPTATLNVSYFK